VNQSYTVVAHREFEDTGYGFRGHITLSRRSDGLRWKFEQAGFRWVGNEGGYHSSIWFGHLAEARDFWLTHFDHLSELTCDEFFSSLA
jgi:hypothetical protein